MDSTLLSMISLASTFSGLIVLDQDNKSTVIMAVQGTFQRTKHLIERQSYIREGIKAGEI